MHNFRITIIADATSSLSREELESKLVVSLFDIETEQKLSDGESDQLQIVDYELVETVPSL
jgi:hypothetical protein